MTVAALVAVGKFDVLEDYISFIINIVHDFFANACQSETGQFQPLYPIDLAASKVLLLFVFLNQQLLF